MLSKHFTALLFFLAAFSGAQAQVFADLTESGKYISTSVSGKYILYWGEMQANFLAAHHWRDTIEITPGKLRKSLTQLPKLWDGSRLATELTLTFEDVPLRVAQDDKPAYYSNVSQIDARFLQEATPGTVLQVSNIALTNGGMGHLVLVLIPEDQQTSRTPYINNFPFVAEYKGFDGFQWGPYLHHFATRDYFTVKELETTLLTQPVLNWFPDRVPYPLEVTIRPILQGVDLPAVRIASEGDAYSELAAAGLLPYRHFMVPGSTWELSVGDAREHSADVKAWMSIVAEDDPRLLLTRNRNGNKLSLYWNQEAYAWEGLYLKSFTLADGSTHSADHPWSGQMVVQLPSDTSRIAESLGSIQMAVNEGAALSPAYEIHTEDHIWKMEPGAALPPELMQQLQKNSYATWFLEHFTVPDSDIDLTGFRIIALFRQTFDRSTLEALLDQSKSSRISIRHLPLSVPQHAAVFQLVLPEYSSVHFRVFHESGALLYETTQDRIMGQSELEVPYSRLRPGKLYLFAETPLGVGLLEWAMPRRP